MVVNFHEPDMPLGPRTWIQHSLAEERTLESDANNTKSWAV